MSVRLSASVVTYASDLTLLGEMLDSLRRSVDAAGEHLALETEVFVVINDEDPEAVELVRAVVAKQQAQASPAYLLSIIEGHGNVGYGPGQNRAIALSKAEFHLLLNPDIVMEHGAVLECLRFIGANPDVAMLAPQGFDPRNEYARLAKRSPSVAILALRALALRPSMLRGRLGRKVAHYTYGDELPSQEPHEIELASGCFMFCRTSALRAINGFDERYFLYFEDYDLSIRIREFGKIMEVPFARIVHYGGHTMTRGLRRVGHFLRSSITYFNSHGWAWL